MPHPPKTESKKEKAPKTDTPAAKDKVAAAKPVVEKKVAKGAKKV